MNNNNNSALSLASSNNSNNNFKNNNVVPTFNSPTAFVPAISIVTDASDSADDSNALSGLNTLPENFWAYCEDWNPQFNGIYPQLLQGLLQTELQDMTFKLLHKSMKTTIDKMIDRTSLRAALLITATVPYLAYLYKKSEDKYLQLSTTLYYSLMNVVHGYSGPLWQKFKNPIFKNYNELLKEMCPLILDAFFEEHSGVIANYLNSMLENETKSHFYQTIVYKMCSIFLQYDANYIHAFENIITKAHKAVTTERSDSHYKKELADAATELVSASIDYLKLREKDEDERRIQKINSKNNINGNTINNNNTVELSQSRNDIEFSETKDDNQSNNNQFQTIKPVKKIRDDVIIVNVSPFPESGLKEVSRCLVHIQKEAPIISPSAAF